MIISMISNYVLVRHPVKIFTSCSTCTRFEHMSRGACERWESQEGRLSSSHSLLFTLDDMHFWGEIPRGITSTYVALPCARSWSPSDCAFMLSLQVSQSKLLPPDESQPHLAEVHAKLQSAITCILRTQKKIVCISGALRASVCISILNIHWYISDIKQKLDTVPLNRVLCALKYTSVWSFSLIRWTMLLLHFSRYGCRQAISRLMRS